jgi:organic radical activating enzyme
VKESKTFCSLPWIHMATHPHGGVTLCCIADHTNSMSSAKDIDGWGVEKFKNLNVDSINDIMNSTYYKQVRVQMLTDQIPEACTRCFEEEKRGIESKRINEQRKFPDFTYEVAEKETKQDGYYRTDIRFVELRLGNLCNVKCRSCNPASSTKWITDYKKVEDKFDYVTKYGWVNKDPNFGWIDNPRFWNDFYEHSKNLELIYINGGEPTLVKQHWNYLERLVDGGYAKNLKLWYSINMTNMPDYAIDIWKKFKQVDISCSIDDLGERNTWLRNPTKWEDVLVNYHNLINHKIDNFNISINQTISWLNVYYLDEFYDYFKNKRNTHIHHNMVYDPNFLSPWILPEEVKFDIINKCHSVMQKVDFNTIQSQLMNNDSNMELLEQGIKYNDYLDKLRKEDMREVFSELFRGLKL